MILKKQNSHLLSTVYYVYQVTLDTDRENKKEGRDIIWVHNELKTPKNRGLTQTILKEWSAILDKSYSGTEAEEEMGKSNLNLSQWVGKEHKWDTSD